MEHRHSFKLFNQIIILVHCRSVNKKCGFHLEIRIFDGIYTAALYISVPRAFFFHLPSRNMIKDSSAPMAQLAAREMDREKG